MRAKKRESGKLSPYIDNYPPVFNPQKKVLTNRVHPKFHLYPQPGTDLEKKENELSREMAEKIFLKRMKSLVLDEDNLYNKEVLEGDFLVFAKAFLLRTIGLLERSLHVRTFGIDTV